MNILESVLGNTSLRVWFSATDRTGRDRLIGGSGKKFTVVENRGSAVSSTESSAGGRYSHQEGQSEVITERFDSDTINYLNAVPGLCIVECSPMSGFTRIKRPVFVDTIFMTSREEYLRRKATPWPAQTESTILGPPPAPPQAPPAPTPAPDEPQPPAPKSTPKSSQRNRRSAAARSQAEEELANYLKQIARPNQERTDDESIDP
jgi:hypothetical protein